MSNALPAAERRMYRLNERYRETGLMRHKPERMDKTWILDIL